MEEREQIAYVESEEGDLCELIFTTGTTGKPKGVMLSYRGIYANMLNTCTGIGMRQDDIVLNPRPLNHSFGMRVLRSSVHGSYLQTDAGTVCGDYRQILLYRVWSRLRECRYEEKTACPFAAHTVVWYMGIDGDGRRRFSEHHNSSGQGGFYRETFRRNRGESSCTGKYRTVRAGITHAVVKEFT